MMTPRLAALSKGLLHPARTAIAAVLSMLAARLLGLPEVYWAPISAMIVIQSTLVASLTISWQRLVGTVLGSAAGALLATCFRPGLLLYGAGIFGIGLLCAALRLDRSAYRYAAITLTIVMFAARAEPAWVIGIHRSCEVSTGIVVGLIVMALFPEKGSGKAKAAGKGAP
jgi:uncharacterized membrane protein YgaE (UPF0421/DUF939 family)